MGTTLIIGNKNYSSWSLRAWLVLRRAGIGFDELLIPLDTADTRDAILRHSPSGRVPCLKHEGRVVWDSLAIAEYAAELAPDRGLWPADPSARALARSVSAEMHAGFAALRAQLPMNLRADKRGRALTPEVERDIARIADLWAECRARFGEAGSGPFLFGAFTIADAFYAPVVTRFRTYGVPLDPMADAYASAIMAWPDMVAWIADAKREPWTVPADEV